MNKKIKSIIKYVFGFWIIFLLATIGCDFAISANRDAKEVGYMEFTEKLEEGSVENVVIYSNSDLIQFVLDDGQTFYTDNPKYEDFKKNLLEQSVSVDETEMFDLNEVFLTVNTVFMYLGCMFAVTYMMTYMMSDHKQIGREITNEKINFNDVAGLKEVKEDLMTVVDMMKNPKKYEDNGAKIPNGIMLYGPPGTGKTLLARAIAGEAGVNFLSASGADFSNKFVGVGGDRVRELFAKAKAMAPCILFIDEIDAVGCARTNGGSDASSEKNNTINALLTEMDGFTKKEGVLVIGATNRLEDLDEALMRPGRFDNQFAVNIPTKPEERLEVIQIYANGKRFDETVDFNVLSKQLLGNSPAEIQAVMNEAAIIASTKDHKAISSADLNEAYLKKVLKGHLKNGDKNEEEIKLVAYHEAGHTLVSVLTGQEVSKVTILSTTSGAGGFTLTSPTKLGLFTKKEMENKILSLYAGRAAEEFLFGKENVTTGAVNDIKVATNTLRRMICEFGMSENGSSMLNYEAVPGSEKMIADQMNKLSDKYYKMTVEMLMEHREQLNTLAENLIKRETLEEQDILALVG